MSARLARFGPLAGLGFVVLMVVGNAIAGNSPDPDSGNAKIAKYLGDSKNYHKSVVAWVIIAAALVLLVLFVTTLRHRIAEVEPAPGRLAPLAFGAGLASAVLGFIAISLFISPAIAAHDAHRAGLDPAIYRLTQDLGYMIWVGSSVVGSLVLLSTSTAALSTGLLPRWFGWLGVVLGILCLGSFFFFPIMGYYLWIAIAGVLLFLRRPAATSPPATT